MPKVTLTDITSGYDSASAYNANNDRIEAGFDNTLSRDGTSPNQMGADLDMNSNAILNLPAPTTDAEPARWADVKDGVSTVDEPIPSQTGNAKTPLTTNGTSLVFSQIDADHVDYTPAGSGAVQTNVQDKLRKIHISIEDFGAIPNDETAAVANYTAIRNALTYVLSQVSSTSGEWETIDTVPTLHAGPGNFWIEGNSPFGLNRSEIAALGVGSGRYRRGFNLQGSGRESTIFTLKNTGSETWFYSNADPLYDENNSSTAQDFAWKDFTIRAEHYTTTSNRKYKVASANSINGFELEANGWEAYWAFENLQIEGLDTFYKLRGSGNGDQNTFKHVRLYQIIDKVFDISNDQSVTNRIFGCDVFTYGDVFYIGEKGGGDYLWEGGSIVLYPQHQTDNLPDSTISAADPRGFLHYNLGTKSSGVAPAFGNANFYFHKLRFELYDDYQHAFFSERGDIVHYGLGLATFEACTFTVDQEYADDATTSTARNSFHDLVRIDRQSSNLLFNRCAFGEYQRFRATDVGSSTVTSTAEIRIYDSALTWDTSNSAKGMFITRFFHTTSTSDQCNLTVISERNYATTIGQTDCRSCEDFVLTGGTVWTSHSPIHWAELKQQGVKWPSSGGSQQRLYLPEGAMVTDFFIAKPAGTGTGSATFRAAIYKQDGTAIVAGTAHQEEDAHYERGTVDVYSPIQAAPNNFIRIYGLNGSAANVTQSKDGTCVVGYIMPTKTYTGTVP